MLSAYSITNAVPMEVDEASISIQDLPLEILSRIVQFLPVNDLHTIMLLSKTFAEAAAHPFITKKVCYKIGKSNSDIFLASKQRFRNIVLVQLNLDNRSVKRLWNRIGGEIVDLTLDRCELRGGTMRRMLRDAKNLKALAILGLAYETICKWRAVDFKGLTTNVQRLTWNRTFMQNDVLAALLNTMPGITEISLEGWCMFDKRVHQQLPPNVKDILLKRLPHLKSLELISIDVVDVFTFASQVSLSNLQAVRLETIYSVPNDFLSRLNGLKTLSMKNVYYDNHTMGIVNGCTNLECLELSRGLGSVVQLENIESLQSLKKLTMHNIFIPKASYSHLMKLKLVELEELKLTHCGLDGRRPSTLIAMAKNLRVLVVSTSNTNVTQKLFESMLEKMVHLQELEIGNSTMKKPLSWCHKRPKCKLQKLALMEFNFLTDKGLVKFSRFPLVQLMLKNCYRVSLEGCKQLILKCPTLQRFETEGIMQGSMTAQNLKRFRPVDDV